MNRLQLRTKALSLRSWHADVDDDFYEEVNENAIDPALKRLAAEVPEAFVPDQETVVILADKTSTSMARTVSATTDEYVMDLGLANLAGAEAVTTTGEWDGIYHIEMTYNGKVYRRQCREFWVELQAKTGKVGHALFSIDRPWNFPSATGMTFRLHQPAVFTRDDVVRVVDGRLFSSSRDLISILPAGFVRYAYVEDYQGQSVGTPVCLSRWNHFQIPAPNATPAVALTSGGGAATWQTDREPPGTFKYRTTFAWGKRDAELKSPGGTLDPMWESAPSPESAAINVPGIPSNAVRVSGLTNIDWQMNFDPTDPTLFRNSHSGMRTRIYRMRTTVHTGGTTIQNVEAPGIYFFLDEVDGIVTGYTDDGSVIPDYARRLPESTGYWAWAVTPHQNDDYEMDLRVDRRPAKLQCDSDAPPINPAFEPMLLNLILGYICQIDKSPADAAVYFQAFTDAVKTYRALETNPADYTPAVAWAPTHTADWPNIATPITQR